jgi:deferrochelatase/peroxidase EfeB
MPVSLDAPLDFYGEHQAGIVTPAQDRMHFVALDVVTKDRAQLVDLLKRWTRAAYRMTAGAEAAPGGVAGGGPYKVPEDTGEAYGLPASGLTLTIGFGPSLFDDRFGLADRRPEPLKELPAFRGDQLDPARSGGDLCIQACANDPQVAVHAVRNLVRLGFGVVSVRWSQLGFGRTSSTSTTQATARNLFGFKDGTNNLKAEETAAVDDHVWVAPGDLSGATAWMSGGTYLVARRIRMHIEVWDRSTLQDQEQTIGRRKASGAPLGKDQEFDEVDLSAKGTDGQPAIPVDSHIALASSANRNGIRILRRGYNFTDGTDGFGHLDAGLFFLAFVRNPETSFVPMQRALAEKDRLNEYIEHNGSALFACPPGVREGGYWGDALFA